MDLYEYQGKELFRRVGIPVSDGRLAVSPEEARQAASSLGGIARIVAGEFRPTPSEFACSGCPALDLVCAGPRLRSMPPALVEHVGA